MPTKSERTALIFLSAVVLAGGAVRLVRAVRSGSKPEPLAATALAGQRHAADSAARAPRTGAVKAPKSPRTRAVTPAARDTPPRDKTPSGPVFPIDVNRATADELMVLPRIGPALAARIVAERAANGPFDGLDALDKRIKGVGAGLARLLQPLVTFSAR